MPLAAITESSRSPSSERSAAIAAAQGLAADPVDQVVALVRVALEVVHLVLGRRLAVGSK